MASAEQQTDMSMVQSQLNQALEWQEKNKQFLQEVLKVKILINNRRSLDTVVESTKMKFCEDKLNKERQKQSEHRHLNELKCLGFLLDYPVEQEKSADNIKDFDVYVNNNLKSVTDVSNDKHPVDKEPANKKLSFAAEAGNETACGYLESEKRHSESGGRPEIEELSTEAEETAPVCSKFGRRNKNEIPDGNNITPPVCSDVDPEKNKIKDKENTGDESNSTSTTKTEVPITALDQDRDETVNRRHVYAKVIILNKKDDDSDKGSCNVEVSRNDMIPYSTSRRSPCQCGDHDDHFDEIIVSSSSVLNMRKEDNRKTKKEKKRKTNKREKMSKTEKKSVREDKVLTTKSTKFHERLLNLFCFPSNIEERDDLECRRWKS